MNLKMLSWILCPVHINVCGSLTAPFWLFSYPDCMYVVIIRADGNNFYHFCFHYIFEVVFC